ncbi:MAG: nucleotidyl transferase AbiEii/AbiGii toxin family protein [Bacteroidales bacterium]|nr:nucleotidyl transferase AbiEii/AbiGii toxin family protein [Bacteroidales bacterium]
MIDQQTYTLNWIETISKRYKNADKILIEKAIRALTLLTDLKDTELDFIFKGGTALMLMLKEPKRLSIDIDIIAPNKEQNLENFLNAIVEKGNFNRFEEQARFVNSQIEKAHYKFFYTPTYKTHSDEEYILLDILFENNPYSKLTEIPISSPLLSMKDEPASVKVPTFENILGDKLTAFPPNTTGIPYYKSNRSMSMEIMKQLYDIGNLFNVVTDVNQIKETFSKIAQNELIYRHLPSLTPNEVLNDIIQTALCISTRGKAGECNFPEIQKGIERLKQFIISDRFLIDNAILAASKAAYISTLIKIGITEIQRFDNETNLSELIIENPTYNKLNKLKKNNREAFWYWWNVFNNSEI